MSRNSKANRKRRAAKEARRNRQRTTSGAPSGWASAAGFYDADERLTVSVIRSASGQHYPEEASIPFPDREVLDVVHDVTTAEVDTLAQELSARIKAGEYPSDARVSIMGGWHAEF